MSSEAAATPGVVVRAARHEDVAPIIELIHALAEYERAADQAEIQVEQLAQALFGSSPRVFAHVVEHDGAVAGMAIWFVNYSTWTGQHGIYLEDLFVRPEARKLGAGRALVATLARLAVERGYTRVEWAVLNWNTPAIDFYHHLGARPQDEWTTYRLVGAGLRQLAEE